MNLMRAAFCPEKLFRLGILSVGILGILFIFPGCSSERGSGEIELNKVDFNFRYPHPNQWQVLHLQFIAGSTGDERVADVAKCMTCHRDIAKALFLGPSVSCGAACHSSDGTESVTIHPSMTLSNTCSSCHRPPSTASISHFPEAAQLCETCHKAPSSHTFGQDSGGTQNFPAEYTCLRCHTVNQKSVVHSPVAENNCSACHAPHGSSIAKILKKSAPSLCYDCHSQSSFQGASVHGAINQDSSCLSCHSPHSADREHLLSATPRELCLSCHSQTITGSRNIPNIAQKVNAASPHSPAASGSCTESCHKPHASNFDRLLTMAFSLTGGTSNGSAYALCFDCHDQTALIGAFRTNTSNFTRDLDGDSTVLHHNQHYSHVVLQKISCNACHDSHGSSLPHQIREAASSSSNMVFTHTATGGSCSTTCHYGGETESYERIPY